MTFQAEIIETGVVSAADITSHTCIQDWITQGAQITFDFVLIAVDSSCQGIVTSIPVLDSECNNPITKLSDPTLAPKPTSPPPPADTQAPIALLGGVLARWCVDASHWSGYRGCSTVILLLIVQKMVKKDRQHQRHASMFDIARLD